MKPPLSGLAGRAARFGFIALVSAVALGARAVEPVTELRVMSFNIWVNGGTSLAQCIDAIRAAGADVVGLQECNAATAQAIATGLGFHHLGVNDVSILSRYPIANVIPTGGGSAVALELSPGQRVYLFNCHLAAYPYGPYSLREGRDQAYVLNQEQQTRMPALNQLLATMAPYLASSAPTFLTGDFNAPSHLDYAAYPWPTSLACSDAGLFDSYRAVHSANRTYPPAFAYDDPGITWTPMTSQEPNHAFDRIDFVYAGSGDGVTAVESAEFDGRNSANPWPSDHRAVLSRFTLPPPVLEEKASEPIPASGASNTTLNPILSWLPGRNTLSHRVHFGPAAPPPFHTNQTNTTFAPGRLEPGVRYHWRVDEVKASGIVTGEVWTFTTGLAHRYEWNFAHGDFSPTLGSGVFAYGDGATTSNLTVFGTSDGVNVPHLDGQPATYLWAPAFTQGSNGYQVTFPDSGPNGGGVYVNQYIMIWDLLIPAPLGWTALFNTNPQNANDADFYVDPSGRLGIGAIGYSPEGTIAANTWYRIAFAADLAAGMVTYYVNGAPVFNGSADLDGRHSLYSNLDPGPDILLFNEGDSSGTYTHAVVLSSFAFVDQRLAAAEILALGGPKNLGIFVTNLPPVSAALADGRINLAWTAAPDVRLQKCPELIPSAWQDVPNTAGTNRYSESVAGETAFYRLIR